MSSIPEIMLLDRPPQRPPNARALCPDASASRCAVRRDAEDAGRGSRSKSAGRTEARLIDLDPTRLMVESIVLILPTPGRMVVLIGAVLCDYYSITLDGPESGRA